MNETIFGFEPIAFWTVATGALVNVSCGVLGCFMVLRRMSLMGDAISHAVLPGLALAFMLTGSRSAFPMLAGALAAGVLTAFFTQLVHRHARVPEDSAMGVVFTSLFALGVILITRAASQVDLDPGCVLYGILESAALDTTAVLGFEVPRIALTLAAATAAVFAFVVLLWKELKLASFDPALATTLGFNAQLIHYLLMGMVAAVAVVAFEAVGSILVVAMLIAPAATAHLLTDRLAWMVVWSAAAGISASILGVWGAIAYHTSPAGMMAFVAGLQFALVVFVAPRHGYLARKLHQARLAFRIVREDVLAILYRWEEMRPSRPIRIEQVSAALGGGPWPRLALFTLEREGKVRKLEQRGLALGAKGLGQAGQVVRGHRLWESYLAKHIGLPADHLHLPADRMEHYIGDELRQDILKEIPQVKTDPHGKPIPTLPAEDLGKSGH